MVVTGKVHGAYLARPAFKHNYYVNHFSLEWGRIVGGREKRIDRAALCIQLRLPEVPLSLSLMWDCNVIFMRFLCPSSATTITISCGCARCDAGSFMLRMLIRGCSQQALHAISSTSWKCQTESERERERERKRFAYHCAINIGMTINIQPTAKKTCSHPPTTSLSERKRDSAQSSATLEIPIKCPDREKKESRGCNSTWRSCNLISESAARCTCECVFPGTCCVYDTCERECCSKHKKPGCFSHTRYSGVVIMLRDSANTLDGNFECRAMERQPADPECGGFEHSYVICT